MRPGILFLLSGLAVAGALFAVNGHPSANQSATPQSSREDAYRANNIGVALLEQFNYKEAAAEFRRALKLDPTLSLARVNLGIALYNLPEPDVALRELKAAADIVPASPQVHYVLGLIARAQNRTVEGIAEFERVLQIDPRDPGANINLGQLLMQQRKYSEAIAAFRAAIASEVYNVTATYNLAMALTRSGERQEGQSMMQNFQTLRSKGYATTIGQNYLEQGRYAEAISSIGSEPGLVNAATPEVIFTDATSSVLANASEAQPASTSADQDLSNLKARAITDDQRRQIFAFNGGVVPFDFD